MESTSFPRFLRQWHLIYYLIATFGVATVGASLYVHHRITAIYVQSVRQNRTWETIERQASILARSAAEIDRPGNEVFESRDIAAAKVWLERAVAEYVRQSKATTVIVQRRHPDERTNLIVSRIREADASVREMETASQAVFRELEQGNDTRAGKQMALLDRAYARVNAAMFEAIEVVGEIKEGHLDNQIAAAAWFHTFEYVLAAAALLMVAAAFAYGVQLDRRFGAHLRERQAAAEALRAAHDRLEERVAERTGDLRRTNENLNGEVVERRRVETALRESAVVRLRLVDQLMTAQEDERRRIAHELHDGVSQMLTSLSFGLQSLAIRIQRMDPDIAGRVDDLHGITGATLEEVRRLAYGLRPLVLDDLGLAAAIERLVAEFSAVGDLQITLRSDLDPNIRLTMAAETAVYRLLQEALTNIRKHSGARRVSVRVETEGSHLHASVQDDGTGFDPVGAASDRADHIGLASMRQRVEHLHGEFAVIAAGGQGTTIRAKIPLEVPLHA